MGILDDLLGAYSSAYNQMTPTMKSGGGSTSSNLLDALGTSQSGYVPSVQTTDKIDANPQIITMTPDQVAAAQAQNAQAAPTPDAARVAAAQAQAPAPAAAPAQVAPQAPQAPQAQAPMPTQQVSPSPVASVDAQPGFPSPSDYNADGSQAASQSGGGLIGALAGAGQQAASDPVAAKGLLSQLGDSAQSIGQKLKSLSPAASQALIATGLTMLGNNDGQHNLAQLVGQGGIAGVNEYQTVTQNNVANQLARQKLAQDLYEKQQANQLGWYNANTTRMDAANKPITIAPGDSVITPGMLANGQSPMIGGSANGQLPVKTTRDIQQPDGSVLTQGYDIFGKPVGQPTLKSSPYTGELSTANQKTVNDANDTASKSAYALSKTQNFIKQLTPTIPDPNNPGQTIPNPDYVPVTGGVAATVGNELNKITGGQTQSQLLRSEIQQNVYQAQLGMWKPGIGGRLTNTDVNLLRQGMPPDNASGQTLQNYLTAYGHLQEDQATHDALNAQYMTANRGDTSPLHRDSVINGQTYPAGTTMQQVLSRQAPVQSSAISPSYAQAQGQIAQIQAIARDSSNPRSAEAQAALKQRGVSW